MNINTITIDGPAGSGKGTIAKKLAAKLDFTYLDTGAMYRTIAYAIKVKNIDEKEIEDFLDKANIDFKIQNKKIIPYFENKPLDKEIRTDEISNLASKFSQIKFVRDYLVKRQRELGSKNKLVAEGRDMGSVVFPNAKLKIYLDASLDERAKRRYLQNKELGFESDINEIKNDLEKRDEQDSTREHSPLIIPADAHVIDTTNLTIEEVIKKILSFIV